MERYLIIVSRDRPELLQTLNPVYGQEGEFEIILDRRGGQISAWGGHGADRRTTLSVNTDLQAQGFMVIKRL